MPEGVILLLAQREVHVDNRCYFHRLSIEEGRLVQPLLHSFLRRRHQQRMAAHERQILNGPVLADDGVESHHALNARLLGKRRIKRLGLANEVGLLDLAAHADALHRCYVGLQLHRPLTPVTFRFELYASGEYSKILESQWNGE